LSRRQLRRGGHEGRHANAQPFDPDAAPAEHQAFRQQVVGLLIGRAGLPQLEPPDDVIAFAQALAATEVSSPVT
jgi:hypothetical protein